MSKTVKRKTGDAGETLACKWLEARGYTILDRNVSNNYGEIDIIAKKNSVIHFIEVKTRQEPGRGFGIEAVGKSKLDKVVKCAQALALQQYPQAPMSIDAMSIDQDTIRFFENITL